MIKKHCEENEIVVLTENGIEESGTHAELLAKGGIYQKLCEMSNLS